MLKDGPSVQRLKWLEHANHVLSKEDVSHAILRLKLPLSALQSMKIAEEFGIEKGSDLCHNFGLSIRAERTDGKQTNVMTQ